MIKAGLHLHRFNDSRDWLDRLSRFPGQEDEVARFRASLDHAEAVWNAHTDDKSLQWRLHHSLPRSRLLGQPRPAGPVVVGCDRVGDLLDFSVHKRSVDQDVAVFYGGVGDARHFLGQLAMLHTAERLAATAARKAANNNNCSNSNGLVREVSALQPRRCYHFTMCDNQARVFARNLILFALLDELATTRLDLLSYRMELYAVVYFAYLGVVMPRFAHERLMQTIDDVIRRLEDDNNQVLSWLRISNDSRADILQVLRSWRSLTESFITADVLDETAGQLDGEPDTGRPPPRGCEKEYNIFFKVPFLQPPPGLLETYEPELLRLLETNTPATHMALRAYIAQHWRANVTLLNTNPREQRQDLGFSPFDFLQAIRGILSSQEKGGPLKTTLYEHVQGFFHMAAAALRILRDRLTVEMMTDDPVAAIDAISMNEDRESPVAFDLVHLTNVSFDRLDTIVQGRKILKPMESARLTVTFTSSSSQHDTLGKDHLFKLTQMQPLDRELPTPFRTTGGTAERCYIGWWRAHPGPFNYEALLPRADLTRLLVTHFYNIALPSPTSSGPEATTPNLTSFFRLLLHLHEIGYPPHWLAEILHKILDDQQHSAPFVAEMTTLAVLFERLLPFFPTTPARFTLPAPQDIYSYTAHLPLLPETDAALTLIFFRQHLFHDLELHRPGQIRALLSSKDVDNANPLRDGRSCIVITTLEWSDDSHQQIRFWMRRDIMDNITTTNSDGEEWACALWRVDDWSLASSGDDDALPLPVRNVVRLGEPWVAAAAATINDNDEMMFDV